MIRTFAAAAVAASVLTVAASADDTVVIDVAGVDFSDPAQAEAVYDKVVEASREVCADIYLQAPVREVGLATRLPLFATCVEQAIAGAVASAGEPALAEIHAAADLDAYALASN